MFKFLVIGFILTLSACGGSNSPGEGGFNSENSSQTLNYSYELNGCKTGEHSFSSQEAYCQGLKDFSLNHGCAASLRKADYDQNCSAYGKFSQSAKQNSNRTPLQTATPSPFTVSTPLPYSTPAESLELAEEMNFMTSATQPFLSETHLASGKILYKLTAKINLTLPEGVKLMLSGQTPVIMIPDTTCALTVSEFTNTLADGSSQMSLAGVDDPAEVLHPCQTFIQNIHQTGGLLRFTNIATSDSVDAFHIEKLTILIQPQSMKAISK